MSRPYYPTKKAWAKARVTELKSTIREIRHDPAAGFSHARRRKYEQIRNLERELSKFERLVSRYEATGQ